MPDTSSPIRMVCFDWGGVILRICRSFPEGLEAAGLPLRDGIDDPQLYDVRKKISAEYQIGAIGDAAFFRAVSDAVRGLYTPDEIAAIHDAWLLEEYPGIDAVMAELNALDEVETAILSNTNARHWARRLADFPTCGMAQHQHASHLLGLAKPDPAIYAAFAESVGVEPSSVLFFDDLEENIRAATSAGWRAEHIDHQSSTASQIRAHLARYDVLDAAAI